MDRERKDQRHHVENKLYDDAAVQTMPPLISFGKVAFAPKLSQKPRSTEQSTINAQAQTVNCLVGCYSHLSIRTKRKSNHVHSRHDELCIWSIGRNSHNATPTTQRCRDVKIPVAIEGQTLRATEP